MVDQEAAQLLSSNDEAIWKGVSHSFFLMDSSAVLRWNRNDFLPDPRLIQEEFVFRFLQSARGSFIVKKWKAANNSYLVCVMPLHEKYSIANRYLVPNWDKEIFVGVDPEILDPSSSEGYPITFEGNTLFKVQLTPLILDQQSRGEVMALTTGWLCLLFFLLGLYQLTYDLHREKKYSIAFLCLLIGLVLVRAVMINFNFPKSFSSLYIYDPLQFASSSLNPSIADLFFNTITVLVLSSYFFYTYYRWRWIRKIRQTGSLLVFVLASVSFLVCYYTILFPFLFFETISHNSNISLDISQSISFDLIRVLAFLSIILGSVAAFMFCHAFLRTAINFTKGSRLLFYLSLLASSIVFMGTYMFSDKDYLIPLIVGLTYFLLLDLFGLNHSLKRLSNSTFLYFFLAIAMLAVVGSLSIKRFVKEKTKEDQYRYGRNFLVDRDIMGEYLLNESVQRISKDPFIQVWMSTPFFAKSIVRQKINQVYLNNYFDRYDVHVYLYNGSGESHDDLAKEDFATLIKAFQNEANKTSYDGIYVIETKESIKRYLAIIPIEQHGPVGFVVLDLSLKRLIPQNVFPELLVDNQFTNYFRNADFSYAFFQDKNLIANSGSYNYERDFDSDLLENSSLYRTGFQDDDFVHIGMEDDLGRIAIVSAAAYRWFNVLANFSFLFTLGLCFVLIGLVLNAMLLWRRGERLNYAARIQVYVYLAFLLPLIAVTVTTLNLISRSEESELKEDFLRKSKVIGEQLSNEVNAYKLNREESKSAFEGQLVDLAKIANLDISVFSNDGKLIGSSQPLIYQNQLVSSLIDREAWHRIVKESEVSFVKNDAIGKLKFNTSYAALKSPGSGELIGILSIPFYDSLHSLEKTQINVWSNILIVFIVVFILFTLVSFFVVSWLTFPLRFITRTLGRTSFSATNKPLAWKSNDEIGLMVGEYNRMLENLELSKIELSRIQKESAWREIAKQIAHEINNPLTPMKLTLQRMELAQAKGTLNKEDTEKSLSTLLTQVEILNQIASSFSAFARMPAPVLQKMDIASVLQRVVDLHANYASATIRLGSSQSIAINGDEQLLTRVFSNIVLNALQSVEEGRNVDIEITTKVEQNFCLVSITDNGSGIEQSLKEKVFLPHFSTKKTGSGIGLAIAKQGIELSGGEIWFDSESGRGTIFYVKLPLAN